MVFSCEHCEIFAITYFEEHVSGWFLMTLAETVPFHRVSIRGNCGILRSVTYSKIVFLFYSSRDKKGKISLKFID